ncbi:MAG: EF-hand domain-containing protein, partial [Caulobacteraceae bacterium]
GKPFHAARGAPYPVAAWFAEADANHDGKLTREEFRQDAAAFFKTLDLDHNGILDGDEVARYEDSVAPEILPDVGHLRANEGMDTGLQFNRDNQDDRQRRGGYREPRQPGPATIEVLQGAGLFGLLNEPEPIAAADLKFDGRITLEAFESTADKRFDLLDTKQLGYLTLATLPKTPVQKEIERRAKQAAKQKKPDAPPEN